MVNKQEVRDKAGNLIGRIEDKGSIIDARDRHGNKLGYYLPADNKTRDRHGNILTIGNTLSELIMGHRS
jgi:hypothetical protein